MCGRKAARTAKRWPEETDRKSASGFVVRIRPRAAGKPAERLS